MFGNIKVSLRLGLGFGLTIAFMVAIISVSLYQEQIGYEKLQRIVKINNVRLHLANEMVDNARESSVAVKDMMLIKYNHEGGNRLQERREFYDETRKRYEDSAAEVRALIPDTDIKGFPF